MIKQLIHTIIYSFLKSDTNDLIQYYFVSSKLSLRWISFLNFIAFKELFDSGIRLKACLYKAIFNDYLSLEKVEARLARANALSISSFASRGVG